MSLKGSAGPTALGGGVHCSLLWVRGQECEGTQLCTQGPFPSGSGLTPYLGPVWVQGRGRGMRGAGGEAADVARTVCVRRALRARISPVGVAELKCIWPRGLRGVANRYF